MSEQRAEIPGSAPSHPTGGSWSPIDSNQNVSATIVLHRSKSAQSIGADLLAGRYRPVAREDAAEVLGADAKSMDAVRSFAANHGLRVVREDAGARTMQVEGTVQQMDNAFGVRLEYCTAPDGSRYMSYQGSITVPQKLSRVIMAVLGLDQRPMARPHAAGPQ